MEIQSAVLKKESDLWLKAAVVGGLWASLEIIIGSFLHNARLPMAGSTLAFFGTVLLIGYYQLWPQRGLIIRAGLIAAIMKSVSPSAIILGPMMGIMLEAILIELVILLLGRNFVGYLVAGIFSVSSALFYKIFSMIVFYGYDLLQVYVNIINFGLKQLRIDEAEPMEVLIFLLVFYVVMGGLASVIGYLSGQKALSMVISPKDYNFSDNKTQKNSFFEISEDQKTSVVLLLINIIAVPFGLFLLNFTVYYGYIFVAIYLIIFGYVYRYALRRLKKPVFWIQLVIIVLLSALFWKNDKNEVTLFQLEGIYGGVEMIVRALFVVVGFSAISVELRNRKVKSFLMKVGMGKYYQSIGLAFSALPAMISSLPKSKDILTHPVRSLLLPLAMGNYWLELFKNKRETVDKV
jgi:hypothetical protein